MPFIALAMRAELGKGAGVSGVRGTLLAPTATAEQAQACEYLCVGEGEHLQKVLCNHPQNSGRR